VNLPALSAAQHREDDLLPLPRKRQDARPGRVIEEERLLPHKRNKAAQRRIMGRAFFDFFEASINKCETKLPGLAGASAPLLADVRQWCLDNRWLG